MAHGMWTANHLALGPKLPSPRTSATPSEKIHNGPRHDRGEGTACGSTQDVTSGRPFAFSVLAAPTPTVLIVNTRYDPATP